MAMLDRQKPYIVPWSGGKDSTATIIVMRELGIPILKVVHVRMMATDTMTATHKVMTDFVDACIDRFRGLGIDCELIKSRPFKEMADRVFTRSKYADRVGHKYGFTDCMRGMCTFQKEKVKCCNFPLEDTMLGICADEPNRMRDGRNSILYETGVTQADAMEICKKNGLLSPLYAMGAGIRRDGCFFCPNASKREREYLTSEQKEFIAYCMANTPLSSQRQQDWRKDLLKPKLTLLDEF